MVKRRRRKISLFPKAESTSQTNPKNETQINQWGLFNLVISSFAPPSSSNWQPWAQQTCLLPKEEEEEELLCHTSWYASRAAAQHTHTHRPGALFVSSFIPNHNSWEKGGERERATTKKKMDESKIISYFHFCCPRKKNPNLHTWKVLGEQLP